MAGKRGASQGSPLRVAPGVPSGSGWGPRALYKAIMRSTYIRPGRGVVHLEHRIIEIVCTTLGPRWILLCWGVDTAHTLCPRGWWSPQNHHTDHRAAGCVCRDCVVKEENWAFVYREVVDGKNTILNAQLFEYTSVGDRGLRKECAQRVLSALCTEASPNQRRQLWLIWRPSPHEIDGCIASDCGVGLCSAAWLSSLRWGRARWNRVWSGLLKSWIAQ